MTQPSHKLPTDEDVDGLLLKAAASGRMSKWDLGTLIAYVKSLRTGGVPPGSNPQPRRD